MLTERSKMDLFGDLPEPETTPSKTSTVSLYDDVPDKNDCTCAPVLKRTETENDHKRKVEGDPKLSEEKHAKLKTSVRYRLSPFFAERQGERDEMQDEHVLIEDMTQQIPNLHPSVYRVAFFAVYDGHGGARASRFASKNLHKFLLDKFPKGEVSQVEKEMKKTLVETFKKTDDEFLKEATKIKPSWKDGTTATVIVIVNETAFIACLGDSQAVLCRGKEDNSYIPIPLTTEHSPSVYEERIRIQKAGGHVKDGRVLGVLEVSRSIGDGQYKKLGVSCIPDVKKCQLTDQDRFIVLACDGLWKCFSFSECTRFTNSILEDESIQETDEKTATEIRCVAACQKLANEAVLRLSADNVTVVLISIAKT
ncbi:integrin-linked kinase-associated serine/threonine phosphatase 2C-like [Ostrea edulis]|uniref:integrin-linked kinase-associated serine/threonine phosphatase 2C-like n=1 Tax=Ostrea edulis TaxID=37623 RepID=UPI0020946D91|nr:integrin-linked kinase-associated serine/threonine phosphatase 2C-like [Ostrea edulis]